MELKAREREPAHCAQLGGTDVVTSGREGQPYPSLLPRWMNDAAAAERSLADKTNVDMKTRNVAPLLQTFMWFLIIHQ